MPQIYMIINKNAKDVILGKIDFLIPELIQGVEKEIGLEGLEDVALTIPAPVLCTYREKDIQIEIRYTAGRDEYGQGKPFDISIKKQKEITRRIREIFLKFFSNHHLKRLSVSVWYKPYYKGIFQTPLPIFQKGLVLK